MFFDWCSDMRISVSSICSGVAPISRANWVSVCTFFGIRLTRPICSGRMSWRSAVSSDITMTPSRRSTSWAGRVAGILIGMDVGLAAAGAAR